MIGYPEMDCPGECPRCGSEQAPNDESLCTDCHDELWDEYPDTEADPPDGSDM